MHAPFSIKKTYLLNKHSIVIISSFKMAAIINLLSLIAQTPQF